MPFHLYFIAVWDGDILKTVIIILYEKGGGNKKYGYKYFYKLYQIHFETALFCFMQVLFGLNFKIEIFF